MPDISIRIEGVDRVIAKLGKVEGARVLDAPMQEAVRLVQRDMQEYPPPIAMRIRSNARGTATFLGQGYRRTGTLGRRWTVRVRRLGDGVVGSVGNNTHYAPFVQSRRFQAWMHRGRWQTDALVIQRRRDEIVRRFQAAIRQALGR